MTYNFDERIDRTGRGQAKWEPAGLKEMFGDENMLSYWVADMDFRVAQPIRDALIEAAEHGCIGYTGLDPAFYNAYINWQKRRNGWEPDVSWFRYTPGVVPAINLLLLAMTNEDDEILIQRPVYYPFTDSIVKQKRTVVSSSLVNKGGRYEIDFEDFEKKASSPKCTAFVLCNPHNPAGRVWERWALEKAMEVFEANQCFVISDEIWADITYTGHQHTPTLMVNDWAQEHTVAVYAPSKTFNLAGLIGSYHIIYNKYLRDRVTAHGDATHYNEMNVLSMHALIGAYSDEGREWVSELLQVLEGNCKYACDHIRQHYDGVDVSMPQGTYMLFLDLTDYCRRTGKTLDQVIKAGWDVGVAWQDGRAFHGPCHIRMNLASPLSRIQEAFDRLDKYVFNA